MLLRPEISRPKALHIGLIKVLKLQEIASFMVAGVSVSLHRKSPNPEWALGQPEAGRKDNAFYLLGPLPHRKKNAYFQFSCGYETKSHRGARCDWSEKGKVQIPRHKVKAQLLRSGYSVPGED